MAELAILTLASLFAGFVDAIVGGGGLVLVPALFSTYPGAPPATLFGTNKAAAIWGTAWSTRQYARRVDMPWGTLLPAAAAAMAGSFSGALSVSHLPADGLRQALPFVLLGVLLYTLGRKDLGNDHLPRHVAGAQTWRACGIGAAVGFYDGVFGPGTGSFLVFLFVRVLGFDFLHASASAKLINTATNAAALILFGATGHVWWALAAAMAVANVVGSLIGTTVALRRGAPFVRRMFIAVVGVLILKTAWDAFVTGR
jgi:uncharacterized membrane protein YfcA